MTLRGVFRDGLPFVALSMTGKAGSIESVECIVDTAFNGELKLPSYLLSQLSYFSPGFRRIILADGSERDSPFVLVLLDWEEEERVTEVLVTESGNPLIGTGLLMEHLLTIELTESGEVSVDTL